MSGWRLHNLDDGQRLIPSLVAAGMRAETTASKATQFARAAHCLHALGLEPASPVYARFVPGRIEVLGKHTDYAGGRSLTAATEQGFAALAVARDDGQISVTDAASGKSIRFPLQPDLASNPGDWSNYPRTVARRVARNFPGSLGGADIAFHSDLPLAAGMSSSSALVVVIFQLLADLLKLPERQEYQQNIHNRLDLAGYVATIENGQSFGTLAGDRGVGTFGGSEDHTAILNSRAEQLVQYAYCPVRAERSVSIDKDYGFVIASSGVLAEKTGRAMEKYNRAARLAVAILQIWCEATGRNDPHLAAVIVSAADAADRLREMLRKSRHTDYPATALVDRFEHFWTESEQIIPAVPDVVERQSVERFGQLVDRSQTLGAGLLGNQVAETIWLAESARELGALAASAFGAGFGGSVWALVARDQVEPMLDAWRIRYQKAFPEAALRASFFASAAGPAAFAVRP